MKTRLRLLYFSVLVCCIFGFNNKTYAQINYSEDFEVDEGGWSDDDFFAFYFFPCSGENALTGEMYSDPDFGDYYAPVTVSPSLGNSNGLQATLTYSYSLIDWNTFAGVSNTPDWGEFTIEYSSSTSGPWINLQTITPANHIESDDCAVKTVTFTPAVGPVYIRITGTPVADEFMDVIINIDNVSVVQALDACTGTPAASAAVANQPLLCNGSSVSLSLSPAYTTSGLNYQWQFSADGISYSNVPTGGTSATYSTTQSASMWYRANVSCGAGGTPVTSTPVHVINSGMPCLCDVVFSNDIEPITHVLFAGIDNTTPAAINGTPGVESFTNMEPAEVTPGETYEITLEGNTNDPDFAGYETYFTVFFDWNHDGDFEDDSEKYDIDFIVFSDGEDGVQATGNIEVPEDALPGVTYMRVFKLYDEFPDAACGVDDEFGFGQVEDYLVNVQPASAETPDYANLQWPPTMAFNVGGSDTVYAQVYEPGVTEPAGAGAGITAWIGISPVNSNTNPNTWTTWIPATFNTSATSGNNDEYMATIGTGLTPGTYYYASRFQLNGGPYVYGGITPTDPNGGGFWDGTANVSGVLTVACTTAAPSASPVQDLCPGSTVDDLQADGEVISWYYGSATGGTSLAPTFVLIDGTYYASVTPAGGCESTSRTAIVVNIIENPAPEAEAAQMFCQGSTVADLEAEGDVITWYSAATGGTILDATTALANGTTYYAAVTPEGGCESVARTAVTAQITIIGAPVTEETTQTFCNEADLSDLEVEGDGEILWYAAETGGTPLNDETGLTTGSTYYAAQTVDGCESVGRTAITVEITTTEQPSGDQTQEIEASAAEDATIEDIQITATGTVTWYANAEDAEEGENALPAGTMITTGTYYATQTIDGCESIAYAVAVDVTLGNDEFGTASFSYHPNPVKDVLSLSYDKNISAVEVYNIVGQKVISQTINGNEARIDMSQLSAGTYMVKVMGDSASKTIKVVKQ